MLHLGLMPEKLLRAPRLKRRLRPNFMVKVPSISWWRRFCSVSGRSLGCRRFGKALLPPPKPPPKPPPPDLLRIDLGGESRLGECFLPDESALPFWLAPLLPLLPLLWWLRRLLWEALDRQEVIFERLPVSRDDVLDRGTLGVGEVPAVAAVGAVSSPSSLRAVEEEEENDFRTMRCHVSRIAILRVVSGYVCAFWYVRLCDSVCICSLSMQFVRYAGLMGE